MPLSSYLILGAILFALSVVGMMLVYPRREVFLAEAASIYDVQLDGSRSHDS